MTTELTRSCLASTQGRVVSVLEGGYTLSALAECVMAHLNGLLDATSALP
ncbi:hypothetical protein D5085_07525 [Ectothiorhodospiraceae bacterium BW-2]|nr:hypothetical protein D5085_07525 [Ectothiorhodospiraceae bacterium BW-2]